MRHIAGVKACMLLGCLILLVACSGPANTLDLSPEEQVWIADNPTLRVGNEMDWPPFDFTDGDVPKGFSIDLIRLVAGKLGLQVEFVNGLTWAELMAGFKAGDIDVMPAIYESDERGAFARFTSSYFSQPSVMAVRSSDDSIQALSDLDGRRVAAIRGFMISDTLRDKYPSIVQVPVDNVVEGMTAVSTGDADACIDSIGVMSFVAREHYIPDLRILSHIPLQELANPDLHMAVGKHQLVLLGLLEKGLRSVSTEEFEGLRKKWLYLPSDVRLAESSAAGPEETSGRAFPWWIVPVVVVVVIGLRTLSRIIDRPVTQEELDRMSGARRLWLTVTFSNLKISSKILMVLVLVAATSVVMFGYMDYQEAKEALRAESFNKLTAVREMKAQQIEDYFDTIAGQIITFSESRTAIEAMSRFGAAFAALEGVATADHVRDTHADPELIAYYQEEYFPRLSASVVGGALTNSALDYVPEDPRSRHLQEQYIAENPFMTGRKEQLDAAGDDSEYSAVHRMYHPIIRSFLERFGYYDIFLVDHETGHIIYSVFKEVDYGTSLLTGPYRDTNFSKAFRAARNAGYGSFIRMEDFAPYEPSYNAPASFVASPIFDGDDQIGVLVFQMPIDRINQIMTSHQAWKDVGLGESGETYLVADDYMMRNQSRFLIEDRENYLKTIRELGLPEDTIRRIADLNTSIGLQSVETKGTRAAFSGITNTEVFPDYRGVPVLSSYRVLDLPGVRWAIMSEIDEAEAMAPAERLRSRTLTLMLLFMGAILAISFAFAKTMTRPIKVLTAKANALAEGELGIPIEIRGGDEIAQLGRSFDVMRQSLAELIGGLEDKVEERTAELATKTERLRSIIDTAVDGIIVIDHEGVLMEFSPAAERIFGHLRDEIIGQNVTALMPPTYRKRHEDAMARYLGGGAPRVIGQQLEVHGQRKNGEIFPLGLSIADATVGGQRLFTGIVRDISERKKAESQLKLQSTALESAANAILISDPRGTIEWVNPAFTELTGYALEELAGQTPRLLKSGEHSPAFYKDLWGTITQGRVWRGETVNKRKDQTLYTEEMTITPVKDDEDNTVNFVAIKQDITIRKQLEDELAKANKRMAGELNIGRDIQMSMVPLTFPAFPERAEFNVHAALQPAREVGGDFYDFFFVDDDWFFFCVGDVSDKGVPAALFMAVTQTLIKSRATDDFLPSSVLTRVNDELSADNPASMFVTVLVAALNMRTGELRYTNAGHNPPYIKRQDGRLELLDERHGPVIGAVGGVAYKEGRTQVNRGDLILLYTDGVTEARKATGELFSEERLTDLIEADAGASPQRLVEATVRAVDAFQGKDHQADDITVLALQYLGVPLAQDGRRLDLTIRNRLTDVAHVDDQFVALADAAGLPKPVARKVRLACDELLNNIISYAFEDEGDHEIEVGIHLLSDRLTITVSDDGAPFNPFQREAPDTSSPLDQREVGGLGIHLVRTVMDKATYSRRSGRNVVTLVKHLEQS